VLAATAWNMGERHAVAILSRTSPEEAAVLLATFDLIIF
jgi:hypothetical protein